MSDWPDGFALSRLGPMKSPRRWEPCPKCLTLVRGAHDCKATPERLAVLRYLFVRLSLTADKRKARVRDNVILIRAKAR